MKSHSCLPIPEANFLHLVDGPIIESPEFKSKNSGAVIQFEGIVRADKHENQMVSHIEYHVYPVLADKVFAKIHQEMVDKHNLHHLILLHSTGEVKVGEVSLFIKAYSKHRKNNFIAVSETVDRIKAEAPIWKKEFYVNQEYKWVKCNH